MELLLIMLMAFIGSLMAFGMVAGLIGHFLGRAFSRLLEHFGDLTKTALNRR